MNPCRFLTRVLVAAGIVASAAAARAHGGEDHGPPPAAVSQALLPRATAHSEDLELVAVLEQDRLLVFVDHAATNEPLAKASVEVEGPLGSGVAAEQAPGLYALQLARKPSPGTHPLTFTVQGDQVADLLAAPLVVAPDGPVEAGHADEPWLSRIGWAAGGAVAAAVALSLLAAVRRRRARSAT
jgi:hypothetical protein